MGRYTSTDLKEIAARGVESQIKKVDTKAEGVEYELALLAHIQRMDRLDLEILLQDALFDEAERYAQDVLEGDSEVWGRARERYYDRIIDEQIAEMFTEIWEEKYHVLACHERIKEAVIDLFLEHKIAAQVSAG